MLDLLSPADDLFAGWSVCVGDEPAATGTYDQIMWTDERSLTVARLANDHDLLLIAFPDLAGFEVDLAARTIRASCFAPDVSDTTIRHLLADQVLPRLVAHDGSLVMHAAGVDTSDGAILLVGQSGLGKSTIAASFHVSGHALLGDDAMIVQTAHGSAHCRPLYRSLRLFPDSLAAVFDTPRDEVPVADYTDKRNILDLEKVPEQSASRVRAIYCLADAGSETITLRTMASGEACMALVEQSFSLDPSDPRGSKVRLQQAADLAASVPVFEIDYPRDYAVLPELREIMLADRSGR